jgi:hypothetical protein
MEDLLQATTDETTKMMMGKGMVIMPTTSDNLETRRNARCLLTLADRPEEGIGLEVLHCNTWRMRVRKEP